MDLGLLILRVVFGLTLTAHSVQKLFGWFGGLGIAGTAQMMEQLGFQPPRLQAVVASLVEGGAGLALAAGLLTPLAAAAFISVMFVATVSVHLSKGFFIQNGGFEFNLALAAGALAVAFTGPVLYPPTRRLGSIGQVHPGALLRSRSGSWVAACS
jgi:putative oxidoreductase